MYSNNRKSIVVNVSEEKMKDIEFEITGNKDEGFVVEFLGFKVFVRKKIFLNNFPVDHQNMGTRGATGSLDDIDLKVYDKYIKRRLKRMMKLERKNKKGGVKL